MPAKFRFLGLGLFFPCLLVFLDYDGNTYSDWWVRRWALAGCLAGAILYLEGLCSAKR